MMKQTIDDIEGHLVRKEYAEALPMLLEFRQHQQSPVIDACIIKCMTETKMRDGLAELALEFAAAGHAKTENDMIIVFDALQLCERYIEAYDCLDAYLETYPFTPNLQEMRLQTLFFLERYPEFLALYNDIIHMDEGATNWVAHAAAATVLVKLGRFPDAMVALEKTPESYRSFSRNLYLGDKFKQVMVDGHSIVLEHSKRLVFSGGEAFPDHTDSIQSILVAGDTTYIETYLDGFLSSLGKSETTAHVHVHAMVRSARELTAFCDKIATLSGISISFTYEEIDPSRDGREYFASARFLALNALYARFGFRGSILALDIDSEIKQDLSPVFDYFRTPPADVGLRLRDSIFLEQRVAAGALFLSGSQMSRDYIRDVASYIAYGLYADTAYWYLDQLALYEVYDDHRKRTETCFARVPQHFLDWEFGKDSLIWTTKGGKA